MMAETPTVMCPRCGSANPNRSRFCGNCGIALHDTTADPDLRRAIDAAVDAKFRDAKVLEIETAQAIVARLTEWAKLFAFVLGIPVALLLGTLTVLGIRTYADFTAKISEARRQALEPLSRTSEEAQRIADAYKNLDAQLKATQALSSEVSRLSSKVSQIEEVVRFKPSSTLTPDVKRSLGTILKNFYDYLRSMGVSAAGAPPTLRVDEKAGMNAYYDMSRNEIVISPDLTGTMAPLREYAHRVLEELKPGGLGADRAGLASGLADYFPSSFRNDSDFARDVWAVYRRIYPTATFPSRDLNNRRSFSEIQLGTTEEHEAGTVWGGAFWEIRQRLGQPKADRLLIAAWKGVDIRKLNADLREFGLELLKQDERLERNADAAQLRSVFEGRGLKL